MEPTGALPLIDALLRGALLATLLLLARSLRRERLGARGRTALWLSLGVAVQTLASLPDVEWRVRPLWQAPLVAVSVGNAVLFWLFVKALFDDEFQPGRWHAVAWAAVAGLGLFNAGFVAETQSPLAPWSFGLQRLVPVLCTLLVLREALHHRHADLVEPRRRLRVFIVALGAFYTLLQIGLRTAGGGRLEPLAALADTLVMLVLVGTIATRVLRLTPSVLFPLDEPVAVPPGADAGPRAELRAPAQVAGTAAASLPPTPPDPAEQQLIERLQRLMREDRAYRDEGLSVSSLARRLSVPEYRLRRVINQRLGHRNFNAYVNGLRLADAQAALADPSQREVPVLTIALAAGFQSIGPFNRAFKAALGVTPTEFRRLDRADS